MRNPVRSKPLSKNVKRLMAMAREEAGESGLYSVARTFTGREEEYCRLQGGIFREAWRQGHGLESFSELFMTSRMATRIDYSFFRPGNEDMVSLMMGDPVNMVGTLYEVDRIVSSLDDGSDPVAAVMAVDWEHLPEGDGAIRPMEEGGAAYAYWLGYIYRCECLIHEESSRMVYGAFPEPVMRDIYREKWQALSEELTMPAALEICAGLDQMFVKENVV